MRVLLALLLVCWGLMAGQSAIAQSGSSADSLSSAGSVGFVGTAGTGGSDSSGGSWEQAPSFSLLRLALGAESVVFEKNIEQWSAKQGLGLSIRTPFFLGFDSIGSELGIGVSAVEWQAQDSTLPDFVAIHMFVEWAITSASNRRLQWIGGLRAGNYFMAFDSQQVAGERNESELALSAVVGARIKIVKRFYFLADAQAARVYTAPKLSLIGVRIGVGLALQAPSWIRTVME